MTFQRNGHIPLKGEMIKDWGQYFDDFLKKNLPSPVPLSQFKLNLVKTSLRKGNSFFTRKGLIVFQKGHKSWFF